MKPAFDRTAKRNPFDNSRFKELPVTIIETIGTYNAERYELAEALAQTFEDIDTYEHLLPALVADSQILSQFKRYYWYASLTEFFGSEPRITQAKALEGEINEHLRLLAQQSAGLECWQVKCQQLLDALAQLHTCDTSLSYLAQQRIKPSQLEVLGTQFQAAYQQAFSTTRVA